MTETDNGVRVVTMTLEEAKESNPPFAFMYELQVIIGTPENCHIEVGGYSAIPVRQQFAGNVLAWRFNRTDMPSAAEWYSP